MAGSNVHSPSQLGDSKGAMRGGTDLPSALEANEQPSPEPSHFSVHKWLLGRGRGEGQGGMCFLQLLRRELKTFP